MWFSHPFMFFFYFADPGLHVQRSVNEPWIAPKKMVKKPFEVIIGCTMECENCITVYGSRLLQVIRPFLHTVHDFTDVFFIIERVFEHFLVFIQCFFCFAI